jgi:two-component system sensor histidine kinase RpfC
MNPITALRKRLSDRGNSENDQALVRLWLVGVTFGLLWVRAELGVPYPDAHETALFTGLATWFVLSLGIFAAIWIWPAANGPRRVLSLLADVAGMTFTIYFAGESGAEFVVLYLLFILGDGLRYGQGYLFACTLLSVVAFSQVASFAPWWRNEPSSVVSGWVLAMFLVPLFISLVDRARIARSDLP